MFFLKSSALSLSTVVALVALIGCTSGQECTDCTTPIDAGAIWSDGVFTEPTFPPDQGPAPEADATPVLTGPMKVAGIQYGVGNFTAVEGCKDDICGLTHYVREAAKQGAKIIVTPEYAVAQIYAEASPEIGDSPLTDSRWKAEGITYGFAKVASDEKVTAIFNLITQQGTGDAAKLYNTQVAIGPDGKVLGRHYKFHLFGNETKNLTPGTGSKTNFIDTPAGKIGFLICADIQCVVNGVGADRSAAEMKLLQDFVAEKPDAVFFSAYWTVGQSSGASPVWWPLNVQKSFASQTKTYVVAANTTFSPGQGGGVFDPDGTTIDSSETNEPAIIYGELPLVQK